MSIITRFFSKSAAITSDMIQAEIERAEGEIVTLHSKLAVARSGIMLLVDSEHQAVSKTALPPNVQSINSTCALRTCNRSFPPLSIRRSGSGRSKGRGSARGRRSVPEDEHRAVSARCTSSARPVRAGSRARMSSA